jgi:hypothetical protein
MVFPRKFHFDMIFILCLFLNIIAIFLYENNNCEFVSKRVQAVSQAIRQSNMQSKWYIVAAKYCTLYLLIGSTIILLVCVILQDYFGIYIFN